MDRYYCAGLPASGEVLLEGDEAHHLARVKRARPGDRVLLFDGRGREAAAEVVAAGKRGDVRLSLLPGEAAAARALSTRIEIGVAPPKGKRMSVLLEKATELGVAAIFPLEAARSVVLVRDNEEHKLEKWQRTTIEAAKQSGVLRLPEIGPARGFADALRADASLRLLLDTRPGTRALRDVLREPRASVLALIGPEGGFTDDEVAAARAAGFEAVSLGPTVLRVETGAIAAIAAIAVLSG